MKSEGNEQESLFGNSNYGYRQKISIFTKRPGLPSIAGVSAIQINTPTISRNEFGPRDRLDTVQNLDEFLFNDYLEIDMGTLKDEER